MLHENNIHIPLTLPVFHELWPSNIAQKSMPFVSRLSREIFFRPRINSCQSLIFCHLEKNAYVREEKEDSPVCPQFRREGKELKNDFNHVIYQEVVCRGVSWYQDRVIKRGLFSPLLFLISSLFTMINLFVTWERFHDIPSWPDRTESSQIAIPLALSLD